MGELSNTRHRHRRRPAGAARHRRRAGLPRALRRASRSGSAGPASRWPGSSRCSTRCRCCCPASSWWSWSGSAPGSRSRARSRAGELVAFYGYAAFLMIPLRTATEYANKLIRGLRRRPRRVVPRAGARRPSIADPATRSRRRPPAPTARRRAPGCGSAPGSLTAIVSEQPDEAAALADRLGRCAEVDDDVRWAACRSPPAPRRRSAARIVVSDTGATLFSGRLGDAARRRAAAAPTSAPARCDTASAEDVLEALPDGLDTRGGRARPHVLRRPAAAAGAGPGAGRRPGGAGPGRADLGGRRAHRGPDRRRGCAAHRAGRTTVVTTTSPLLLDRVDEVAFLARRPGRRRRARTRDLLDASPATAPSSPARRTPRPRSARHERRSLPVADGTQVAAPLRARPGRAAHPRMLWRALALHVLAALAGLAAPRLLGDLVEAVEDGHHRRPRRPGDRWCWPGSCSLQTRAHPLRARTAQPGARRAGAGRAARGLRRQRARAAGRRGRVGRLRRPAHPHLARRRPARLVGALGAARVDDRGRHRGRHLRRGGAASAGGCCCPCAARRAAAGDRAALVPRPRQGRLPARERVVLRDQRDPHRDRRGRPHGRGARPRTASGSRAIDDDIARVLRRRALHALPAHRVLPEHGARLPDPDRGDAAVRRLALHAGAASRSARSPRRRSTCRC